MTWRAEDVEWLRFRRNDESSSGPDEDNRAIKVPAELRSTRRYWLRPRTAAFD